MTRFVIALCLALLAPLLHAAPFLRSLPYAFATNVPRTAYTFTGRATPGPFTLPCTVTAAGVPECDAAAALAVSVPLVTFNLDVTLTAGCDATGANCWSGGAASSAPFLRSTSAPTVGAPTGLFLGP